MYLMGRNPKIPVPYWFIGLICWWFISYPLHCDSSGVVESETNSFCGGPLIIFTYLYPSYITIMINGIGLSTFPCGVLLVTAAGKHFDWLIWASCNLMPMEHDMQPRIFPLISWWIMRLCGMLSDAFMKHCIETPSLIQNICPYINSF